MRGIRTLHHTLNSAVQVIDADLDAGTALPADRYGLALCFGVLYHVKNPFNLLESLAQCAQYCILSTRIAQLTPDHRTDLREIPVAYLVDADELNRDATNHWIFSEKRAVQNPEADWLGRLRLSISWADSRLGSRS